MWPWKRKQENARPGTWPLDMTIGWLSAKDPWSLSDAATWSLVLGSTGSGKTSGFLKFALTRFLASGFGGCLLTSKRSDIDDIVRYATATGRLHDLVMYEPGGRACWNILSQELFQGNSNPVQRVENARQIFDVALEICERDRRSNGNSGENKYFERAVGELLRNAMLTLVLAEKPVTLQNIHRLIMSVANSPEEVRDPSWRENSYYYQVCCRADDQPMEPSVDRDFEFTVQYLLKMLPALDGKTRSNILSTYSTMADMLQRGAIRETFFGETTVTPEACEDGKILVFAYPTLEWSAAGKIIQAIGKYAFQRSMLRRKRSSNMRPVFLAADECQQTITSRDAEFQSVARSSLVCTILASQSLPGLYEAVGGEAGKHAISALVGNLRLKALHGQDDPVTCHWQSDLLGQKKRLLFNSNSSGTNAQTFDWFDTRKNLSFGMNESWEPEIQPWEWSGDFRNGGPGNGYLVDAILYRGGRPWLANGKSYLPVTFDQRKEI